MPADLKEGVLRRTRSESDRLVSTYTQVHPIKVQIMGKDCVRRRQTWWVCVLEVNPIGDGCMISLVGDSGCEAEVTATLLTSFNMCMCVPLRAAHKDKVEEV